LDGSRDKAERIVSFFSIICFQTGVNHWKENHRPDPITGRVRHESSASESLMKMLYLTASSISLIIEGRV
jgi:hypothetical protein